MAGIGFKLKATGIGKTIKRMNHVGGDYTNATAAALYLIAEEVREDAWHRTPRDIGYLRDSSYTKPPNPRMKPMEAEVGYGMEYAVYVHERTELNHPVGEAKFLEKALKKKTRGFVKNLKNKTKRLLKFYATPESVGVTAPKAPPRSTKR